MLPSVTPSFSLPQMLASFRSPLMEAIFDHHYYSEPEVLNAGKTYCYLSPEHRHAATLKTEQLIKGVRELPKKFFDYDALLATFNLSTQEGVVLMNLAEALLRIPDDATVNELIYDKLKDKEWLSKQGVSQSKFVDLAARALHLTDKTLQATALEGKLGDKRENGFWRKLAYKAASPVLRQSVRQVVKRMGDYFVMAPTIKDALPIVDGNLKKTTSDASSAIPQEIYSFDMLGEAALTDEDVARYEEAYRAAIELVGRHEAPISAKNKSGISIKLSALHPRFELAHIDNVMAEMVPRLKKLLLIAKSHTMRCTIDAEEVDRLDSTLAVVAAVFTDPDLQGWDGLGLAVQAYQKRALWVLDYLRDLAVAQGRSLNIRLVKGAYWDTEIKRAQEKGVEDYPVFTRKHHTDVNYLACAGFMLQHPEAFTCSFATHNPLTVMSILEMLPSTPMGKKLGLASRVDAASGALKVADESTDEIAPAVEFQRLHGMGADLYTVLHQMRLTTIPCRVYAPIGPHRELLPYLVRRLLENGANVTCVNRLRDPSTSLEEILEDPFASLDASGGCPHNLLPSPRHLYGPTRLNAKGFDTSNIPSLWDYHAFTCTDHAKALVVSLHASQQEKMDAAGLQAAFEVAREAQVSWAEKPVEERAAILDGAADLMEKSYFSFLYACQIEGKKTLSDAVAEVREAIDFCRYYAQQARLRLVSQTLPGVTGEANVLGYRGRGVIVCISPWNFPLAIFIGQVVAALVAGNAVVAKPAHQTPGIAAMAVDLLYQAGISSQVLHFAPARAGDVENSLLNRVDLAGVIFTGSTAVASHINQVLARRGQEKELAGQRGVSGAEPSENKAHYPVSVPPIIPFIAETGGINAMIVDSSALFEQVVKDVLHSGFGTAGQRCSALRLLLLQRDIYTPVVELLKGSMDRLVLGSPLGLSADIPPVIDASSYDDLTTYIQEVKSQGWEVYSPSGIINGISPEKEDALFPPTLVMVPDVGCVAKEVFGPIVHVAPYDLDFLPSVLKAVNAKGFGLTMGIHSRLDSRIGYVSDAAKVGNTYVNRGMTGAIVGSQPFGGQGLSGTGPKAGGPNYLMRLVHEYAISTNTMATGGNIQLMAMDLRR